jgi:hypothetical protein
MLPEEHEETRIPIKTEIIKIFSMCYFIMVIIYLTKKVSLNLPSKQKLILTFRVKYGFLKLQTNGQEMQGLVFHVPNSPSIPNSYCARILTPPLSLRLRSGVKILLITKGKWGIRDVE